MSRLKTILRTWPPGDCQVINSLRMPCGLWIHGPKWLLPPNQWPQSTFEGEDNNHTFQEERKPYVTTYVTTEADAFNLNFLAKYSDLSKLLHVTCYILRFCHSCQKPVALRSTGIPTVCEWRSANLK